MSKSAVCSRQSAAQADRPFASTAPPRPGVPASGVSVREALEAGIRDDLARLAGILCLDVPEERHDLGERLAAMTDGDLAIAENYLNQAVQMLDGSPTGPGWTWAVMLKRSHWLERGRTACGRTWDGGATQQISHPDACRTCERALAARWRLVHRQESAKGFAAGSGKPMRGEARG